MELKIICYLLKSHIICDTVINTDLQNNKLHSASSVCNVSVGFKLNKRFFNLINTAYVRKDSQEVSSRKHVNCKD